MITVELVKLLRRPRTWISVVLTCALPFMVAVFITITHLVPPPGQGSAFLSAVLQDGALYPAAALALVLPVFLPVAVAVVAGDSIAGEATGGTLRYLLVRPVGRTRLLVAKLVSVIVYVLLVVLAVTFTAYATGVFLLGPSVAAAVGQAPGVPGGAGGSAPGLAGQAPTAGQAAGGAVTSLSGAPLSLLQLTERTAGAIAFITVSMLGVAAIALFLSTITDSALGSALGALAALVASEVLVTLERGHRRPALPADPVLAGLDRLLPAARLLAGYPARVRDPGGLRRGVPGRRVGELLHQGHHRVSRDRCRGPVARRRPGPEANGNRTRAAG